jgi:SAM-dependent methyltransferase
MVDKFPDADGVRQRGGEEMVIGSRALIQADGSRLPFRDGQFDYVIASHVIEHVPAPDAPRFVRELQRVARRGYIESPSIVYESMRNIPEHLWFVHLSDGVVHLAPRGRPESWTALTDVLFDDQCFRAVVENFAALFFVGMEWDSSLRLEIHENTDDILALVHDEWLALAIRTRDARSSACEYKRSSTRRVIKAVLPPLLVTGVRAVSRFSRDKYRVAKERGKDASRAIDWRDVVVCPACHGALGEEVSGMICCRHCGLRYTVRGDDIPCLLVE